MKTLTVEEITSRAYSHSTMKSLATELGLSAFMLRYNLGKCRKLDLVNKILNDNKLTKKSEMSEIVLQNNDEAKR